MGGSMAGFNPKQLQVFMGPCPCLSACGGLFLSMSKGPGPFTACQGSFPQFPSHTQPTSGSSEGLEGGGGSQPQPRRTGEAFACCHGKAASFLQRGEEGPCSWSIKEPWSSWASSQAPWQERNRLLLSLQALTPPPD